MTSYLVDKQYDFYYTPLSDANRELMRALYDLLDNKRKEIVCNFESMQHNDRTLTPPPGVKVRIPFGEIVKPTPEELALGSKDLPNGFRIWDGILDDGSISRQVGQFVELEESELLGEIVVCRRRDGYEMRMPLSCLSEEDQEHARSMSRAAAEKPEEE